MAANSLEAASTFDLVAALKTPDQPEENVAKPDYDATVFKACCLIENRIRIFEAERETATDAPATLFDHSEGELKLLNALDWLFLEIPDDAWIVKL